MEDWEKIADDPSEWGKPVRPRRGSKGLSSVVSVRFSPVEADRMFSQAQAKGKTLSSLLRQLALEYLTPKPKPGTLDLNSMPPPPITGRSRTSRCRCGQVQLGGGTLTYTHCCGQLTA